jgi:abortive infection bacteriophage resistance protein
MTSRHLRLKGRLALFNGWLIGFFKHEQLSYAKPYMAPTDLVTLLADERGMKISNRAMAEAAIIRIGYYRLSGYWYPYRQQTVDDDGHTVHLSAFVPGTTIEQILDIAEFDRKLRMLIFEGIEAVEISMRSAVADQLGRRDIFAHRNPALLDEAFQKPARSRDRKKRKRRSDHAAWLAELKRQEDRSGEAFAKHYRQKYGGPFPVWMSTQVMSLGALSTLYSRLQLRDRVAIALDFDVLSNVPDGDSAALGRWLNHIRHVRNLCAHHYRLWNQNFDVVIGDITGIPELAELKGKPSRRVYGTIAVLSYLLARSDPGNAWGAKTIAFVEAEAHRLNLDLDAMGFPSTWKANAMWSPGYTPNAIVRQRMQLLSGHETATTDEMARLLKAESPAKAKKTVNYLRKKNAIIGAQILDGGSRRYPTFQIDSRTRDFHPIVIQANRKLFIRNGASTQEEQHWLALEWWTNVHPQLEGMTPVEKLISGDLDAARLELILPGPQE